MSDRSCHSLALPTLMRYHHHVNSFRDVALKSKNTMQINTGNYSMFHHRHWCMTMSDNHDHNADERLHNGAQTMVYCECYTNSTMKYVIKRQITLRKVIHWKLIQVQNWSLWKQIVVVSTTEPILFLFLQDWMEI